MRLLHPRTLEIVSVRPDITKKIISNVFNDIFKWKEDGIDHPKMFITDDAMLGRYLSLVYFYSVVRGCYLTISRVDTLSQETIDCFNAALTNTTLTWYLKQLSQYFDDNYLFSDACYLYFRGINIFPEIFGNSWEKYVPIVSLNKIGRYVNKTNKQFQEAKRLATYTATMKKNKVK